MKHSVSSLEGALLDAAVAKAEGWEPMPGGGWFKRDRAPALAGEWIDTSYQCPPPSTDWRSGGAIIERERIELRSIDSKQWVACKENDEDRTILTPQYPEMDGPTPLIAAMRAYVASRFGEEVDLP